MPLPNLYVFHPPPSRASHLMPWLAEVEELLQSDPNWDNCDLHRVVYNDQGGFNVPTETDRVRRNPGPVIFLYKVQARLLARFREIVGRELSVYTILPTCSTDIWEACEEARTAYEDGEPRIPLRELIAYLIVSKLARHDMWGGTSLNKKLLVGVRPPQRRISERYLRRSRCQPGCRRVAQRRRADSKDEPRGGQVRARG